jgi:hypothetical protein
MVTGNKWPRLEAYHCSIGAEIKNALSFVFIPPYAYAQIFRLCLIRPTSKKRDNPVQKQPNTGST